uniref:NADH-ubiquinone oxidoreductase chain 6 n=1 Tax=Pichia sorbitophila (strain ATCC MYA-4447 / BCRC 22081 / CBS 7064 / NBRC 10061 / NRRL Y-12695) TaxID=559304 RepID=C7U008_PICSO|nr:NADH dehydrogenase subunit 6 [Millerozyma farinosa]CAY39289.1 NADH dehydrogenase, subunit 6 [Millerozyma farinosa]
MKLISGMSSLLALGMLTPVQSITCLIVTFVSTAMSTYSEGFILMGILYVLIYVGAIAILFLFILSLLNIEYKPQGSMKPIIVTILLVSLIPLDLSYETYGITTEFNTINEELWVVGVQFYTEYAILLLMTGLILMMSVMGAISITK